jgi:hypothetical protein
VDAALSPTASQCAKLVMLKSQQDERASMKEATIIGVDLAKNVFQLHGAAADGAVVFRKKLSRLQFQPFMSEHLLRPRVRWDTSNGLLSRWRCLDGQ